MRYTKSAYISYRETNTERCRHTGKDILFAGVNGNVGGGRGGG